MAKITIDKTNFLAGVSIGDYAQNAGYSPTKKGHNLLKEKGVLYGAPTPTDLSTNLLDNVIATTRDRNYLGNDIYLLDSSGNFYTLDGTTLTKRQTDSVKSYVFGTTDFINFKGNVYATSTTDIAYLTGSDLATIDHDWWTVTMGKTSLSSSYRHPLEVVEDVMYIGDQYRINTWDGTTAVYNALSLPIDQNITAMIKHTNGRNLIVFTSGTTNYSNTKKGGAKMYIIDTVTLEFVNEVEIEEQVNGAINVNGIIYVTYGQNLGYISGAGIQWLRDLDIYYFGDSLGYKHHLANLDNHLLVVENTSVLAYGNLGQGNVFWYPIKEQTQPVDFIANNKENKLIYGTTVTTAKLYQNDYDNAGVITDWYSNKYSFDSDVWIRRIDIIHTETNGSGSSSFSVESVDVEGTETTLRTLSYSSQTVRKTRVDCNVKTDFFQLGLTGITDSIGIRKIIIHYENAE